MIEKQRLTDGRRLRYTNGEPIRCDCGKVVAIQGNDGTITIKCAKCKRTIPLVRAESLE